MVGRPDGCTAFFTGSVAEPVRAGEMQVRPLGVDIQAGDEMGRPVIDEMGKLVVTKPMPSMPLDFWNDPGDRRYRETQFDRWPGVIYGRSDSTLNRHGVRIGTADLYRIVDAVEGVGDSLVVNVDLPNGSSVMVLFVVPTDGSLAAAVETDIRARLQREGSPRHVPDVVVAMPAVPYTLTGKKMEIPVKRPLMGVAPERAYSPDAMAAPGAMDPYLAYAASFRGAR